MTMTIIIAPKIADIIETMIKVKVHPNSPVFVSVQFKNKIILLSTIV